VSKQMKLFFVFFYTFRDSKSFPSHHDEVHTQPHIYSRTNKRV
jgi:hypothetical protein